MQRIMTIMYYSGISPMNHMKNIARKRHAAGKHTAQN